MSSRNPPPIPRRGTPANILRAREQVEERKRQEGNRQRAQAMVEMARANKERRQVLSQGEADRVERMFQSRNELDAIAVAEARDRERQRLREFQERRTPTAQSIERNRQISQRNIERILESQRFQRGLDAEVLAGRKLGGTSQLANALFGGIGLEQASEEVRQDLQRRRERLKHTTLRPLPEPEPEPEPEPVAVGTGARGEFVPLPTEGEPRPRGGDTHGNIYGAREGGGFKLKTPPQPFLEPQPEPEPEYNPYQSRRKGE